MLVCASSVVTFVAQSNAGATYLNSRLPVIVRLGNAATACFMYIAKAIWPANLGIFYPQPQANASLVWQPVLAGSAVLVLTIFAIRARLRRPYFIVGWLWYLGTLVPVVGIVQVGLQSMADRYTYLPLVGLSIVAAWAAADLAVLWRSNPIWPWLGAACLIGACSAASCRQLGFWTDSITLWTHSVTVAPNNFLAQYNLGLAYFTKAQADFDRMEGGEENARNVRSQTLFTAIEHFRESVILQHDFPDGQTNLANALVLEGKVHEAVPYYEAALQLEPRQWEAQANLGLVLVRLGKSLEGETHLRAAVALNSQNSDIQSGLGWAQGAQGKWNDALKSFQTARELEPDAPIRYYDLGYTFSRLNRNEDADAAYRRALILAPDWPIEARREAWKLATHPDPMVRDGQLALRLAKEAGEAMKWNEPEFLDAMAAARAETGDFQGACAIAQRAVELSKPGQSSLRRRRLHVYQEGKPLRQNPNIPGP
jgi:Flp pilus assembly protein TadD